MSILPIKLIIPESFILIKQFMTDSLQLACVKQVLKDLTIEDKGELWKVLNAEMNIGEPVYTEYSLCESDNSVTKKILGSGLTSRQIVKEEMYRNYLTDYDQLELDKYITNRPYMLPHLIIAQLIECDQNEPLRGLLEFN